MKKLQPLGLLLYVLLLSGACMKKRCYICRNENGQEMVQGCDKEVEEIETLAREQNWNCEILPD